MTIKDLPAALRPREKLLAHGAAALRDEELLALLLRTGTAGTGVLQLAAHLLDSFGGVAGLLNADADALKRIKGLGPAKRAELAAVLELARRSMTGQLRDGTLFDKPSRVKDFLRLHLGKREHEVFAVLFLDAQHQLLAMEEMFQGTLTQTSVYTRLTMRAEEASRLSPLGLRPPTPSGAASHIRA